MNHKHSIYYKYDAKTCVGLHYGLLILIALIFGGGTIAALWVSMIWESDLAFLFALILFFCYYFILRRIPTIMLQGILYRECDAIKMKDIIFIIENKVKVEQAKIIWRMLRVQAVSFIQGCEQESFELLQTCKEHKKTIGNELFYLSLYIRHYSVTEEWENYQAAKAKIENLLMGQKPSKKNRLAYERYMKGNEAGEKCRAGKFEEARKLYQELLDEKKSNMLIRVTIHERLAAIDMEEGKYESAKQHLMFVAQNGGTTYMADEAKGKLQQFEQE